MDTLTSSYYTQETIAAKVDCSAIHMAKPIIRSENINVGYRTDKKEHLVSANLNLQIRNGELVCLLGTNGCGKSTLMRSIAGLQPLLAGQVFINNIYLQGITHKQRALLLSMVLTDRIESGNLTVQEIVAVGRHPHTNAFGSLSENDINFINHSLKRCNLEGFNNRLFACLSDGEKQRVMIARALAQDTPLIMLDEPTAHLDLLNRIEMMKTLRLLAKETHKAILLSTHELDLALQWADTIWLMGRDGSVCSGTPEDLVLSGAFSKTFGSNSFRFDLSAGSFKMNRFFKGKVNLFGHGIPFEWTRRALEREGFEPDETLEAASSVSVISANQWIYKCAGHEKTCNSIGELLSFLRHESWFLTH